MPRGKRSNKQKDKKNSQPAQKAAKKLQKQVSKLQNQVSQSNNAFRSLKGVYKDRLAPELVGRSRKDVTHAVKMVQSAKTIATRRYLAAVLDPQFAEPAPIPANVAEPACTTKLSFSTTLKTNSSGNISILFQPQMGLYSATVPGIQWRYAYMHCLNDDSYTEGNNWQVTNKEGWARGYFNFQEKLPPKDAAQWRVVGFSGRVEYIGSIDAASGYFVNASFPTGAPRSVGPDGTLTANGPPTGYGNVIYKTFTEADMQKAYYHGTGSVRQVNEVLYAPRTQDVFFMENKDPAAGVTIGTATSQGGTTGRESSCLVVNGYGLPPNSNCIKASMDVILEYVATTSNWVASESAQFGTMDERAMPVAQRALKSSYATAPGGYNFASKVYSLAFGDQTPGEVIGHGLTNLATGMMNAFAASRGGGMGMLASAPQLLSLAF